MVKPTDSLPSSKVKMRGKTDDVKCRNRTVISHMPGYLNPRKRLKSFESTPRGRSCTLRGPTASFPAHLERLANGQAAAKRRKAPDEQPSKPMLRKKHCQHIDIMAPIFVRWSCSGMWDGLPRFLRQVDLCSDVRHGKMTEACDA